MENRSGIGFTKVLIVAKTRQGNGACVGGITFDGQSVRLIAADAATNEHAGLEYRVGEVSEAWWQRGLSQTLRGTMPSSTVYRRPISTVYV
jgi:hypothetical protein